MNTNFKKTGYNPYKRTFRIHINKIEILPSHLTFIRNLINDFDLKINKIIDDVKKVYKQDVSFVVDYFEYETTDDDYIDFLSKMDVEDYECCAILIEYETGIEEYCLDEDIEKQIQRNLKRVECVEYTKDKLNELFLKEIDFIDNFELNFLY